MVRASGISACDSTLSCGRLRRRKRDSSTRSACCTTSTGARPSCSWRAMAACGLAQQVVGQAGLDAAAAGQGLQQHAVERAVEADHLQLVIAREELLHDRAAQRQARQRGELGGVLDASAHARPATRGWCACRGSARSSSSRFCSTFCSVLSGSTLGTRSSDSLGAVLAELVEQLLHFLAAQQLGGMRSGSGGSGGWPPPCRHRPPCSRRPAPARAGSASIQTAGRPKAGSCVGVPGRCRVTWPGLIASHWFGKASPRADLARPSG